MQKRLRYAAVCTVAVALAAPASAGWISAITREAGEAAGAAGKAAGHAHPQLGRIGRAVDHLAAPGVPKGSLAAHVTPEGHWQFANKEGQVFTAGTPEEFKRILPSLAPDAAAGGEKKFKLFLSEESVFENRAHLDKLPKEAELHVVSDAGAYPVKVSGDLKSGTLIAKVKPNLDLELADHALFDETVASLSRPLNKSNIRTIALEPGAKGRLTAAPRLDPATKAALVDTADPANFGNALSALRGQTALITGRIENGKLVIRPAGGGEAAHDLGELRQAAASSDVNLVVLHTDAASQPGGRNWLWQTVSVGGLDEALLKGSFGDFLDQLAANRGGFTLKSAREPGGRVQISASAAGEDTLISSASNYMGELAGHITGKTIVKGVEISARDESSQSELDSRLIPGIPSYVQMPYLAGIVLGIFAFGVARGWWQRIWPARMPAAGEVRLIRIVRGVPRELVFWLIFMPVAGYPALVWELLTQLWQTVTPPLRWLKRLFGGARV